MLRDVSDVSERQPYGRCQRCDGERALGLWGRCPSCRMETGLLLEAALHKHPRSRLRDTLPPIRPVLLPFRGGPARPSWAPLVCFVVLQVAFLLAGAWLVQRSADRGLPPHLSAMER